MHRTMLLCTL